MRVAELKTQDRQIKTKEGYKLTIRKHKAKGHLKKTVVGKRVYYTFVADKIST